ncbi:MAG: A/G-specific adenine glycosylase [Nocardioides sp.]
MRRRLLEWYDAHARDLPWRRPEASAWSVMVSEFMLQQTPVSRVLPVHEYWLERWPTPSALAAAPSGEAVRAWGRLGYPRRALRLHAAAAAIVTGYEGVVPSSYDELIQLPGVGDYTAAAIAAFAYRQRTVVLDTNIRRVLARAVRGIQSCPPSVTSAERATATELLPETGPETAAWSVALMELGALVCTATDPGCARCPIERDCAWRAAGAPPYHGPTRATQAWAGTDRQCRGRLLAVVREADGPVHRSRLDVVWHDDEQRQRCLESLLSDGLVTHASAMTYALPD